MFLTLEDNRAEASSRAWPQAARGAQGRRPEHRTGEGRGEAAPLTWLKRPHAHREGQGEGSPPLLPRIERDRSAPFPAQRGRAGGRGRLHLAPKAPNPESLTRRGLLVFHRGLAGPPIGAGTAQGQGGRGAAQRSLERSARDERTRNRGSTRFPDKRTGMAPVASL